MSVEFFEVYPQFPSTHRSRIERACDANSVVRQQAIDELLRLYEPALKAHLSQLAFQLRMPKDFTEDWFQDFAMQKILEEKLLEQFDPKLARFRTFLLSTLNNLVISEVRRIRAIKR